MLAMAGAFCLAAQLERVFLGALPHIVLPIAGIGLILCMADWLRGFFPVSSTPCRKVSVEEGSCIIGDAQKRVQVRWTCASMRGWRPQMEDTHVAGALQYGGGELGLFAVFDGHGGWE